MKTLDLRVVRPKRTQAQEGQHLFGWAVFILLLCGFAVFCWIGTFYVFSNPEQPLNYKILSKLKKLEPPRRFELTGAPLGEFVSPQKLLERYGAMSQFELNEQSAQLLRNYLRNYDHQVGKVPYITGKFTVLDSSPLSANSFMDSGVITIAQSTEVPSIYIEHLFPAPKNEEAGMMRILAPGLGVELRRSYDLSAVIHVSNLGMGRLLLTCVPLLYGPYGVTQNGAGFQLEPPKTLGLKGTLPVLQPEAVAAAEKRYAETRSTVSPQAVVSVSPTEQTRPNLRTTESSPTPNLVPVARALPVNPTTASAKAAATPRVASAAPATRNPSPAATPPATAATPPMVSQAAPEVPLQPFLTASPTPETASRVGAWTTFRAGQMPRGRLLDVDQSAELADRGVGSQPVYLRGDFTVTAARENRVVMRPHQSLPDKLLNRGNARVIAEFPRGLPAPREGDTLQRGADRPFQIVEIRKGADGQLNIYVREVTTPL